MEQLKDVEEQQKLFKNYSDALQMLKLNSRLKEICTGVALIHLESQEEYFRAQLEKAAEVFMSNIPRTYFELYNNYDWDRDDYIFNLTIILKEHPELMDLENSKVYNLIYSVLERPRITKRYKDFLSVCKNILSKRTESHKIDELFRVKLLELIG